MTGFAFYSCEDVVDNPAQDPAQSWNYSVSVKFDAFDFTAQPTDPVTGETNVYKVPTTLYVLNEENTLMGTITTDAAPTAGNYGTYAGTLTGTIGNNLIITTKIGNDLAKQDGTLASAIENGIVQTAEVPIKIYNANSGNLTTAAAKMENTAAIAHTGSNKLKGGEKVSFISDEQTFEWTVNEKFDPTTSADLYIAIPTSANPDAKYTISTDSKDGFTRGATLTLANYPTLTKGKVSPNLGWLPFENTGVDLTKWDAYQREVNHSTGNLWFNQYINDDKSFIVTQSGKDLDSLSISLYGNKDKNAELTLNNVRLGKNCSFEVGNGVKMAITLIGDNKFGQLNLGTPYTKKGMGTWTFKRLNVYGNTSGYDTDGNLIINYAGEYTIDEDLDLTYLSVSNGGKVTIADGKKVNVTSEDGTAVDNYWGTIKAGKGSTLNAECKKKENYAYYVNGGNIEVGENAIVNAQAGKNGYGMYIYNDHKLDFKIGKNAKVNLIGGPSDVLGIGMYISTYNNAINNITLDEGATLKAVGIDKYGIYFNNDNGATVNINIGKNAKIIAEDTNDGYGIYTDTDGGFLNFDGEGTFEVKSGGNFAMALHTWGGAINFKGGNINAIGGADKAAITSNNLFTIAPEIKSFKATKGADATLYIVNGGSGSEALIDNLVGDKTKFTDVTENGSRTITPKPAEE